MRAAAGLATEQHPEIGLAAAGSRQGHGSRVGLAEKEPREAVGALPELFAIVRPYLTG
jgi:hypothetical protein